MLPTTIICNTCIFGDRTIKMPDGIMITKCSNSSLRNLKNEFIDGVDLVTNCPYYNGSVFHTMEPQEKEICGICNNEITHTLEHTIKIIKEYHISNNIKRVDAKTIGVYHEKCWNDTMFNQLKTNNC